MLVNLGTSHYFEKEIEEIIDQAFLNLDSLFEEENSLEITAIMFEVSGVKDTMFLLVRNSQLT